MCHEIEGLMADFLWHNKDKRKTHWISWDKLCANKNKGGPGFQKIGAFNRAMLTKQLWRIISNPNSVLSHRWIPRPTTFQVLSPPNSLCADATVAELMDEDWNWNEALLREVFRSEDVGAILGISIIVRDKDQLQWHYEKHGRHSVRSAYRLLSQGMLAHGQIAQTGSSSYSSKNWRFIWKADVPLKVRLFMWRA
ncbi:UNVERIFIED_CONTAM: hypothetical protein Slati_0411600 [Sesamum latifolium]|uniref:Reverse transcriptase zinc-binding domain-containing protein n=1 Tax=Sesamum latifolium TaxID=2727402 RepID=A0AAW2XXE6_9LAMI